MKQTNPTENLYAWWVDTAPLLSHSVRVVLLKIDSRAPQVWVCTKPVTGCCISTLLHVRSIVGLFEALRFSPALCNEAVSTARLQRLCSIALARETTNCEQIRILKDVSGIRICTGGHMQIIGSLIE
jgi:hypothetical protein